eukprot:GHVT01081771.1.p1 GENE.GHVT01081771.1~~GHVT01081771.1.p1  ORF type:complete len:507 (+),score=96.26 GHVT01081771.1:1978-3498(+)
MGNQLAAVAAGTTSARCSCFDPSLRDENLSEIRPPAGNAADPLPPTAPATLDETSPTLVIDRHVQDLRSEDGSIYSGGLLANGQRHGPGVLVRPDGSKYEGEFSSGRVDGKGTFTHPSGDVYEGSWKNDQAHGPGKFTHSDGSYYEGSWVADAQEGYGEEHWADKSHFRGHYKGSRKDGYGEFTWAEGAVYCGEFRANGIHGTGTYKWADGRVYTGPWAANHMEGEGLMTWPDGRKYEGQYHQDKKEGWGRFTWHDGRAYIGPWDQGKQHGIGVYINANKENKVGEWIQGKRIRWLSKNDIAKLPIQSINRAATDSDKAPGTTYSLIYHDLIKAIQNENKSGAAHADAEKAGPAEAVGGLTATSEVKQEAASNLHSPQTGNQNEVARQREDHEQPIKSNQTTSSSSSSSSSRDEPDQVRVPEPPAARKQLEVTAVLPGPGANGSNSKRLEESQNAHLVTIPVDEGAAVPSVAPSTVPSTAGAVVASDSLEHKSTRWQKFTKVLKRA